MYRNLQRHRAVLPAIARLVKIVVTELFTTIDRVMPVACHKSTDAQLCFLEPSDCTAVKQN